MLDLISDIENDLESGREAVSHTELQKVEQTREAVARVARAFWITVAILLVFNSARLETWVNGFEVGPVQNAVVALSSTWNAQMMKGGFGTPAARVRAETRELRSINWSQARQRFESERHRTREGAKLLRGMLSERQG